MPVKILDGREIRNKIISRLKAKVDKLTFKPGLAVVLVGDGEASKIYVANKETACRKIGYYSKLIKLPKNISKTKLLKTIELLNKDSQINGILVQFPLPKALANLEKAGNNGNRSGKRRGCISSPKCSSIISLPGEKYKKLLLPATPSGILNLLKEYGIKIKGKQAVIVGRSNLVGKPVALLLLAENATVTICHSQTISLDSITSQADILIAAVGRPNFFNENFIKPGGVVVDSGINRTKKGLIIGDVNFTAVKNKVSAISPVPGGVGPMTVAALMENVLKAYELQHK